MLAFVDLKKKLHLKIFRIYYYLHICAKICVHVWMSEDNLVVSVVLHCYMGSGDQIQAIMLGQQKLG